ncbi:MAG: RNA polymerase-associated protein RapA [Syntrophus sp. PtaU1.Bin208]|nr:MAG: RNA polymerase-associated protein RapA [Syntrophus sp. PtaU1.Bin208]
MESATKSKGRHPKSGVSQKIAKSTESRISRTQKPVHLDLEQWQRQLRRQFGEQQKFQLENRGNDRIFSEFALTNPETGRTYRIAIRGEAPGDNFCSCPDYRINNLGTCKHIAYTLARLKKMRGAKRAFKAGFVPRAAAVDRPAADTGVDGEIDAEIFHGGVKEFFDGDGLLKPSRILDFHQFLNTLPACGAHEVRCYDDVIAFIAEHQDADYRQRIIQQQLPEGIDSPLFMDLLKTDLYPYQREGALFAARAGRSLIGDDMGLGKTIQAMAAAELMAFLFHIEKVLIVSPTSLKYQWKGEIERFTDRQATVIEGLNQRRGSLYGEDSFYKLINYELVWRDTAQIKAWAPDLIILDEAQRIKNWQTRTAKYVKELESPFVIVLTGTPIENRIEELHSLMEVVDRHHFGPLYRFVHEHRVLDDAGKVIGYRNLEAVRKSLAGVMIRRKKDEVLKQLPQRIDKNFFVPMTQPQWQIHDEYGEIVTRIVAKWRRYRFLSEADQRRLQIALNMMRMAADNTYLVDKRTVNGPKIEELDTLLQELIVEGDEKVVIFSQWLRMAELVEEVLKSRKIGYVQLNGMVPSKDRKDLMNRFREDPDCKVFLSTDAGGVGLNLQSGSVVINMDVPWNPAILEQRIGRVHRLGQKRPVRVINFVTKDSIEERILGLLRFKKSLFTGALDENGQDVVMVGESQLQKIMESVEAATDHLAAADPQAESQEVRETQADEIRTEERETAEALELTVPAAPSSKESAAASSPWGGEAGEAKDLGSLLVRGAEFLAGLGQALAQKDVSPREALEAHLAPLLARDDPTGKAYLKIPVPEPEVIQGLFTALGGIVAGIMGKQK